MKEDKTFLSVAPDDTVRATFELMKEHDISQLPVVEHDEIVGSILESNVLNFLLENPMRNTEKPVRDIMGDPFPRVDGDLPLKKLGQYISRQNPAVVTQDTAGRHQILTQYDVIRAV